MDFSKENKTKMHHLSSYPTFLIQIWTFSSKSPYLLLSEYFFTFYAAEFDAAFANQTKNCSIYWIWWTVVIFGVFIFPFRLNHHLLVVVWLLHDIREIEEQKKEFEKKKRGNFIVLKRESWVFACAISILLSMELTFSILLHNPFCPHCIYRLQFLPSHCKCLCSKSVCVSIYKEYKFIVFILSYFLQEKLSVDLNAVHKNVFQMHFGFFCVLLSCLLPCVAWNVLTYKVNNIIL